MINKNDYVRVETDTGAIEGPVFRVENKGNYNLIFVNTGFHLEGVSDDMYEIEVLRVAVPPEPTELGTVWTQGNHTYVRYSNSVTYPWIDAVTAGVYTWEQIHERHFD